MPARIFPSRLEIESVGSTSAQEIAVLNSTRQASMRSDKINVKTNNSKIMIVPSASTNDSIQEDEKQGDVFDNPLSTGRSTVVDCFMSIRMLVIALSLSLLFITCLIIWISSVVVINQGVSIDISIISIISWLTFVVMSILTLLSIPIIHYFTLKRPLQRITLQLFKMKKMKFEDIEKMPTLIAEFIPFFSLFWEFNKVMKEIRPFIPESLFSMEDDDLEKEQDRLAEEHREKQLIEMRKLVTQRKQVSKTSLVSSFVERSSVGGHSHKSKVSQATTSMTSNHQQKVSLELGLSSYVATVLVIQFRNFDGRSYPISTDLLGVFTMLYQKVQSVSKQFRGRATIVTPKIIMVSFENGRSFEKGALMCAVHLKKQMEAVNSQLKDQVKLPELDYGIGVSRSECLVGNIGTSQVKYFSLIGECSSNALKLASLNATLRTKILTDESMTNALLSDFISRPVHFSKRNSVLGEDIAFDLDGKTTQKIIELIGEDKVNDDEWLYELQQKEDSQKYVYFEEAFEMLLSSSINREMLRKSLNIIGDYVEKDSKDLVSKLLHNHLSTLLNLRDEELRERMKSFCLEDYHIDLKLEPTFVL